MVIVKSNAETEAGALPTDQELAAMGRFNEELMKAGILLDAAGLQPTSKGARVRWSKEGKVSVVDGPFPETKELIAGYWILQCRSKAEVVEWMKRCPNPSRAEGEVEIRQFFELGDFEMSAETRASHDALAARLSERGTG
jgi:hypothetical protein